MQKFSQKYAIVALLEDRKAGDEFMAPDWPQHVTLADVFAVEWRMAKQKLASIAAEQQSFSLRITGETYFGDNQDVHVLLLDKRPEVVSLHEQIVSALEADDVIFNVPQYVHGGFVPHTTVRDTTKLKVGDAVEITNFAIIDMFPDDNPYRRRIISRHKLTGARDD